MIGTPVVKTELREGDDEYVWLEKEHREEITALTNELERLRASRDMLLAAAKEVIQAWADDGAMGTIYSMTRAASSLRIAIAKAEEPSAETAARAFMDKHPHATSPSEE